MEKQQMREKMVELLYEAMLIEGSGRDLCEKIADHLIANGVTFAEDINVPAKWIPVTERLPDPFVSVLAYVPSEAPLPLVHESYISDNNAWVCILDRSYWKKGAVTHWMPLPEPPVGGGFVLLGC